MPAADPIRFSVSYSRAEYIEFVRAHQRRMGVFDREFAARSIKRHAAPAFAAAAVLGMAAIAAWLAWRSPIATAALVLLAFLALLYGFVQTPLFVDVLTTVVGGVVFSLKKRRIGDCEFTIGDEGIRRRARDGEMLVPWKDVVAVHEQPEGYLVEKAAGAMPIPRRCLTPEELERMHELPGFREKLRGAQLRGTPARSRS